MSELSLTREEILELAPEKPTFDLTRAKHLSSGDTEFYGDVDIGWFRRPRYLELFVNRRGSNARLWYWTHYRGQCSRFEDGEVLGAEHLKKLFARFFEPDEGRP